VTPRPPWPFRPGVWRSPLRGPWLTSVLGSVLLVGIPILVVTGLVSYAAYNPRLGHNDTTPARGVLGFYLFSWITNPSWIYRVSQGTHVILGLVLTPVLLAKLWSVIPRLFAWPPIRSIAYALERISVALLVGGAVFEFFTGIFNVEYFYPWKFSFYDAHFFGAWVFLAGFTVHLVLKTPRMWTALRSRSLRAELRTGVAETEPEAPEPDGLAPVAPSVPTMSRRGLLGVVGGASFTVLALTLGESVDPLRSAALLAPRGRSYGSGPNDFQINKTAIAAGINPGVTGDSWRLVVHGPLDLQLSRAELLSLPQHSYRLPIACVEGWSTEQTWTGVRLADLARMVDAREPQSLEVRSLEEGGAFGQATLSRAQVSDSQSLLALRVNGADLSLDHGYPARVIVPAAPGVHNTKWVRQLSFRTA
jgi:DMSO/TMAO reductase YedYZ molybdopterin-dependent catalytic subunit